MKDLYRFTNAAGHPRGIPKLWLNYHYYLKYHHKMLHASDTDVKSSLSRIGSTVNETAN